jgi:predicted anti-sigma-YlaC factor YlaD
LGFFRFFRRRRRGHGCREVRDNASAYLEGEARPRLAERIRQHLGACRDCDGFVGTLKATVAALRNLPVEKPSEATLDRVRRIARS